MPVMNPRSLNTIPVWSHDPRPIPPMRKMAYDSLQRQLRLIARCEKRAKRQRRRKAVIKWIARLLFGWGIDSGVTRAVILRRRKVIKFPRFDQGLDFFLRGWLGNRAEHSKWTGAAMLDMTDPPAKEFLAPVRRMYLFGLLLVMERCETITVQEFEDFAAAVDLDGQAYYFSDLHENNFGRYQGRIVCLDYAD